MANGWERNKSGGRKVIIKFMQGKAEEKTCRWLREYTSQHLVPSACVEETDMEGYRLNPRFIFFWLSNWRDFLMIKELYCEKSSWHIWSTSYVLSSLSILPYFIFKVTLGVDTIKHILQKEKRRHGNCKHLSQDHIPSGQSGIWI